MKLLRDGKPLLEMLIDIVTALENRHLIHTPIRSIEQHDKLVETWPAKDEQWRAKFLAQQKSMEDEAVKVYHYWCCIFIVNSTWFAALWTCMQSKDTLHPFLLQGWFSWLETSRHCQSFAEYGSFTHLLSCLLVVQRELSRMDSQWSRTRRRSISWHTSQMAWSGSIRHSCSWQVSLRSTRRQWWHCEVWNHHNQRLTLIVLIAEPPSKTLQLLFQSSLLQGIDQETSRQIVYNNFLQQQMIKGTGQRRFPANTMCSIVDAIDCLINMGLNSIEQKPFLWFWQTVDHCNTCRHCSSSTHGDAMLDISIPAQKVR